MTLCQVYSNSTVARVLVLAAVFRASPGVGAAYGSPYENLAASAKVTAESRYSAEYDPHFTADGRVPREGGHDDVGKAWAVRGESHREGCTVTYAWESPVTIAEIVYYGRTAWFASECWKDYRILADEVAEPVLIGTLQQRHGPQRIRLSWPVRARALRIEFTSSYGGPNPGASEIQILAESPSETEFADLCDLTRIDPVYGPIDREFSARPESAHLREQIESGDLGFDSLVVIHRQAMNPTHVYTYHNEGFSPGGGLYIYSLGREPALRRIFDAGRGQILDADLSWNGGELLFSYRRIEAQAYQVYRMQLDGGDPVQLTEGPSHNFNACWLPDGDIAFLSTRKSQYAYCWTSPVGVLHRMDRDGGNVRRLSANYLNDFTPAVMEDGSIIYGRWEYVDRPAIPIQSLWTIHPNGQALQVYYGNRVLSPATFIEPHPIPGRPGQVLCTMTAHNGPCRGAIGIIDPRQGVNAQAAIHNLTPEVNIGRVDQGDGNFIRGPYESPYPVNGEYFLCSREGTLIARDYDGRAQVILLRPQDGMGWYGPRPLGARPWPRVLPAPEPVQEPQQMWATVFLQDVYRGLEPHVKRGDIRHVRIVQELPKSALADVRYRAFGFQFPVVSCGATYAPKKVWGEVEVDPDGSACFQVPAGVPVYFMALDEHGRALQRMRSFTHLMPGETQGCIGCHEPRLGSARMHAQVRPTAMQRRPQSLTPPEWGRVGFSYAHVVQPVFDRHCLTCHSMPEPAAGLDLSGDKTDFFNVSYENLARKGPRPGANPYTSWIPTFNGMEANILGVEPLQWGSPASRLADLVLAGHPDAEGKPRIRLNEAEKRRIFAWIDLNVPYYGTSRSNHYTRTGCRRMLPEQLAAVLQDVAARRCGECHHRDGRPSLPEAQYTRITNPRWNDFLRAPLSKDAGGSGACSKDVFLSTDDPDYQAVMATFASLEQLLQERPRMDMVAPELYEECGPCAAEPDSPCVAVR